MTPPKHTNQSKTIADHHQVNPTKDLPREPAEQGNKGGQIDRVGTKDGPIPLVDFLWDNRDD